MSDAELLPWEREDLLWVDQGGMCALTGQPMSKDHTSPYRSCLDGDRLVCLWVRRAKAGLSDEAFLAVLDALPMRTPRWVLADMTTMAVADVVIGAIDDGLRAGLLRRQGWKNQPFITMGPKVITYHVGRKFSQDLYLKVMVAVEPNKVTVRFMKRLYVKSDLDADKYTWVNKMLSEELMDVADPDGVRKVVARISELFIKYETVTDDT